MTSLRKAILLVERTFRELPVITEVVAKSLEVLPFEETYTLEVRNKKLRGTLPITASKM
jgi:hypothetical protein